MRRMSKVLLGVMMMFVAVMLMPSCGNDNHQTYVKQTPEINITSAVNSADGLDFQLVGVLFQEGTVKDAETLEQELNKDGGINNLDLDGDGNTDYLNVSENDGGDVNNTKSFDITTGDGDNTTFIGSVEVEKTADGYNLHMSGSEEVYGSGHQYTSHYSGPSVGTMLFMAWAFHPRPLYYHPPYYRGYYPSYYGGPRLIVSRSAYVSRTTTQRTVTKRIVTKNKTPRKSSIKSKNKGKVSSKARTSINNNKKSRKSFKKRNKNKTVKKGGFSKNKSSVSKSTSKKRPTRKSTPKKRSSASKSSSRRSSSSKSSNRSRRSDINTKESIEKSKYGLEAIMGIKTYTFCYKAEFIKKEKLPKTKQVGVMAQDVEKFIPEAVITDKHGLKSVDYTMLVAVLFKGMQQQQKQIQILQDEVTVLKNSLK